MDNLLARANIMSTAPNINSPDSIHPEGPLHINRISIVSGSDCSSDSSEENGQDNILKNCKRFLLELEAKQKSFPMTLQKRRKAAGKPQRCA
jgi:hypothetical protein